VGWRYLGFTDYTRRRAITQAAVGGGRLLVRLVVPAAGAAAATGLDAATIESRAQSAAVAERVQESTAAFHAHQVTQRPAFILEDEIGDKVVLSGLVEAAPIAAAIDAMLADSAAYAAHAAHFGGPPAS
jgi:hypothetical protein